MVDTTHFNGDFGDGKNYCLKTTLATFDDIWAYHKNPEIFSYDFTFSDRRNLSFLPGA